MDMSKYKGMFLTEAREHLANMNQLVLALEKEPENKENIDSLFRAAHSIKGMSASMGYEGIAELSHKMEDMMDRFRKGEMSITSEATDILLEGVDALARFVTAVEQDSTADIDIPGLVEKIKGYGTQKPEVRSQEPAKIGGQGSGVRGQQTDHRPPATDHFFKPATAGFNISINISPDSPAPSVRAFLILRKMKELGNVSETTPSEADLKAGRFPGRLSVKITTDTAQGKLEEAIREMGEVSSLKIEPLGEEPLAPPPHPPLSKGGQAGGLSKGGQTGGREKEAGEPKGETPAIGPLQQTVKVNVALLDYFVNTIGELIINKSRLHETAKDISSRELKDGLNQLDRLVRNLQTQVMSVRMMPIESITERFPRVVRDLARREGKEIELVIEGQDIELDRSIIEGLGNPLIHMIRNCIDHGIEPPDERRALGKPLPARIYIKASREKDQVFIEVSDDGRGMDPEILKDAAVKKGLITSEQASEMSQKEALFLICRPGFSTASVVSDISGRGVGMDAVKAAVEPVGGSIDIASAPGEGARITLQLPLTVAIIQSLLVEIAPETYAIPISRVLRTLEVRKQEIKVSQKQSFIDFEGMLTPLLSLRKIFRMPAVSVQEGFISVVVTEVKGKVVGVAVDKLVGQRETFIRPLGRPVSKIAGISGTTVLGNGRTIFLLDVGNLI